MHIGHISFRLAGTDGVSLEAAKIAQVLHRMGHTNFYFAGELDASVTDSGPIVAPVEASMLVSQAHFTHPEAQWITAHAFGTTQAHAQLAARIERSAVELQAALETFIARYQIDLLIVQNVFAIPMNIALTAAIYQVIEKNGMPTIAHSHDFYWEREKYLTHAIPDLLEKYFPPRLPNLQHVVINSQAQHDLAQRGLTSTVLPNIFDFDLTPPGVDAYNHDLRTALGLTETDIFFLQPTRVIPRKGIELAIDLAHRLADMPVKLIISHHTEYNSLDYLAWLQTRAEKLQVDLRYLPERFAPLRQRDPDGQKIYSLWDAYIFADFVTYPSLYEGFGNALIETIFFRKPFLVNRYSVYCQDIEPTGIQAVTIDGQITEQVVAEVRSLLANPPRAAALTAKNAQIATAHFSYSTAHTIFEELFAGFT